MKFRLVQKKKDQEAAYHLRYQLHIKELGFQQFYADQETQVILSLLIDWKHFFGSLGNWSRYPN